MFENTISGSDVYIVLLLSLIFAIFIWTYKWVPIQNIPQHNCTRGR